MSVASPLQWPDGWTRHRGARDRWPKQDCLSLSATIDGLWDELEKLGAKDITISMSMRPGTLSRQPKRVGDPGVAVFFKRAGRPVAMAQDRFETQAGNARSLTLAIAAMRAIERHGGGVIAERAFEGFTGVPAVKDEQPRPSQHWSDVLGVSPSAPLGAIRGAWRMQTADAQKSGDMELAQRLNAAWDEAKRARKEGAA